MQVCKTADIKATLTEKEFAIFMRLTRGDTMQMAAKALSRSVKTMEWHRVNVGKKLGSGHRGLWMYWAICQGLVPVAVNADIVRGGELEVSPGT